MEFDLLLTNRVKFLWLFGLLLGVGAFAVVVLPVLDAYSKFLSAGVATGLFFGGGWLFLRVEQRIGEPVKITVTSTDISVVNQLTGSRKIWLFDDIMAYKFFPPFKAHATLRLTLRTGDKVKLRAYDAGLTSTRNTSCLVAVTTAFGGAWRRYQRIASGDGAAG